MDDKIEMRVLKGTALRWSSRSRLAGCSYPLRNILLYNRTGDSNEECQNYIEQEYDYE